MATNSPLQGVPLPEVTDADNVPYDLGNAVNFIEGRLVMRFSSAADRDAKVTTPVEGMLAYLGDSKVWTGYQSGAWRVVADAVTKKPYCHLRTLVNQSLVSNTDTYLNLATVTEDTNGMADTANNRIVIKTAGRYRMTYGVGFDTNSSGQRFAACRDATGLSYRLDSVNAVPGLAVVVGGSFSVRCAVGAVFRLAGWQNSAANLNVNNTTFLQVEWASD